MRAIADPTKLQHFYNKILGVPYSAHGSKISMEVLESCIDPNYAMTAFTANGTVAGVDLNLGLHTVIYDVSTGREVPVWIGQCVSYADLDEKCKRYGVVAGVMDAGPEIHAPREFVREHPGWYLCRYNLSEKMRTEKTSQFQDMVVDDDSRSVSVNRTESLDGMFAAFKMGMVVVPSNYLFIDEGNYVKQMMMPTRVKEIRPDGTAKYVWTKGIDHFFHASNYAHIAGRLIGGGWDIITSNGVSADEN